MCRIRMKDTGLRKRWRVLIIALLLTRNMTADCLNVAAKIGDEVILPCPCQNSAYLLSWQREQTIVYTANMTITAPQYRSRVQLLGKGCSLILRQISRADEGIYVCFYNESTLIDKHVTLQVTANFTIACEKKSRLYHCEAKEGYPAGTILWRLNGQPLSHSPLLFQSKMDQFTGLFDIASSIKITGNGTVTCQVKNTRQESMITECVAGPTGPVMQTAPKAFLKIPVGLVVCGSLMVVLVTAIVWIKKRKNTEVKTQREQASLEEQHDHLEKQTVSA